MMQVNNNKDGTQSPSGLPAAPSEIKKRSDGEWGTLPAANSRNDINPLPASSGQYQSNVQ